MRHAFKSVLVISTLLLGAAQATSGSMGGNTSISSSTRVEVRGAVLLDAQGRTVGTFMNNGQAMASGALQTATQIRVTFEGGTSKTYSLAGNIGTQARVSLDTLVVRSGNGTALLGQAIRADLQAMQQNMQAVSGKTVTLVSAGGSVVGTFMANGTLRASGDLRKVTGAVVTLGNGQRLSYDLATRLMADASGTLGLGDVKVRDQGRSVALVSVLTTLKQDGKVTTGGANSNGNTSVGGSASASGQVDASTSGSTSGGSSSGGISIGVGGGIGISIGGGK
ncbi:hypothetical protein [Deinococcus apachensis]|uniref:hypothetical protein n=1 Tax=Deinococcus apachensis TaxID=309886 RepID=UPI00036FE03D|nr:hypothetical protein [Deinococcus apachensis]